jgi:ATP-binding cassette, subfamily G (WHITE), member 1
MSIPIVPLQVQTLKREYFNRWYRCNPYFFAMSLAKLPVQVLNSFLYLTMVYIITDQPVETMRIALFFLISILTSLTSESFGLLISSRLSVMVSRQNVQFSRIIYEIVFGHQNGVFIGPGTS